MNKGIDLIVLYGIFIFVLIVFILLNATRNNTTEQGPRDDFTRHFQVILQDGNKAMLLNTDSCVVHANSVELHTGLYFQEYPYEYLVIGQFNEGQVDSIFRDFQRKIRNNMAQ